MIKCKTLSILLIATLTGCVSLAPTDISPATVQLPEYFAQSEETATSDISHIGWRTYFQDPQLHTLIELALTQNSDLKLAILKMQEAFKQYGIEQSNRYPQLDSQSRINYTGQNQNQTSQNYTIGIDLGFELDFFGRLQNMSEGQLQRYLATSQMQRETYMMLIAQVAKAYLREQIITQQLVIIDQVIANYQLSISFIEDRLISGESSYLDYQQAKGLLETTNNSRIEKQRELTLAQHTLKNLLGSYDIDIQINSNQLQFASSIPNNLPSTLLLQRPDIMQAEYQIKASNADIGVARAAFFPSISLTGNLGNSSTELSDLLSGATLWELVPKITLPLFNGNSNRLNLALAEIRRQQATVEYEKTLHAAFKEVSDLLTQRQSYSQQYRVQQQYINTLNSALFLAQQEQVSSKIST